jgi:hypothetical protein
MGSPATFGPDLAESDTYVTRYPDSPAWARDAIDNCAGVVPFIVAGYPDGLYRPNRDVTRDQMAVYIQRGMASDLTCPAAATFPDVPTDHWAYCYVETLVGAAVVQGYPSGDYMPNYSVSRAQMAVYVQRGAGLTMTGVVEDVFPDVPMDFWAAGEILACVDNSVVFGYGDGLYRPARIVDRAQMAVYAMRGFGGPSKPVVVGGPSTSDMTLTGAADGINNPGSLSYYAWTAITSDPSYAYVAFDPTSLDPALASGGAWAVEFQYSDVTIPTAPVATASRFFLLSAANINSAIAAGTEPLVLVDEATLLGLPDGTYDFELTVLVGDVDGNAHHQLARVHSFTYVQMEPPPPGAPRPPDLFNAGTDANAQYGGWAMNDQQQLSGSLAFLTDEDEVYFITQTQTGVPPWCDGDGAVFTWEDVTIPAGATDMVITVDYHGVDDDGTYSDCCGGGGSCCGSWGTSGNALANHSVWGGGTAYPYGWGLIAHNWGYQALNAANPEGSTMPQYWDTWDHDGDDDAVTPEIPKTDSSQDPTIPSDNDIQGGGDTPAAEGYAGHPNVPGPVITGNPGLIGDQTYVWTATNMSDYISGNDAVVVVFCGGSVDQFHIDQLTLGFTVPAP